MNWGIEHELVELAHALRMLTVRHFLGEMTRAEHSMQLRRLLEQYERVQMQSPPVAAMH